MVRLQSNGQTLEGKVLRIHGDTVDFLNRNGSLSQFSAAGATNFSKTSNVFVPLSAGEIQSRLQDEFGSSYRVSSTGVALVVHPNRNSTPWAQRFDELYRSFGRYFAVRGLTITQPETPLVVIVFGSRGELDRYAGKSGKRLPENVKGFYSRLTNRVVMYDTESSGEQNWLDNAAIVVHEATHQTAFNTGVHSRLSPPPLWVAEGLGTMFENRNVWHVSIHRKVEDRLNQSRLHAFRQWTKTRPADSIAQMIESDKLFETNPLAAYGQSWALTFFLAEQYPMQYARYLQRTASHKPFTPSTPAQRRADFTAEFGENWPMLNAQMVRFYSKF